jgi:hypothetical protein
MSVKNLNNSPTPKPMEEEGYKFDKTSALAATSFAVIFLGVILIICFAASIMAIDIGQTATLYTTNTSYFDAWYILNWLTIIGSILGVAVVLTFGIKKGVEISNMDAKERRNSIQNAL